MKAENLEVFKANGRTPRKSSVEAPSKKIYCEKLRSNSSFKKQRPQVVEDDDDIMVSPLVFGDTSRSKSGAKTISCKLEHQTKKSDYEYIPLIRANTKNSDASKTHNEFESDQEIFFSQLAKPVTSKITLESKETMSVTKSSTVIF